MESLGGHLVEKPATRAGASPPLRDLGERSLLVHQGPPGGATRSPSLQPLGFTGEEGEEELDFSHSPLCIIPLVVARLF